MKVVKIEGTNAYKVQYDAQRPESVSIPSPEEMAALDGETLEKLAIRAAFAKESYRQADARMRQAELARAHRWLRPEPKQAWLPRVLIGLLGAIALTLAVALTVTAIARPTPAGRAEVAPYGPPPAPAVGQGRAP